MRRTLATLALLALGLVPAGAASASSASIAGTVVDASTGAPIAGICVRSDGASTTTDANGHFAFDLPAGTYYVLLTSCGNDDYVSAVYDSSSATHTTLIAPFWGNPAATITVTAGGPTQELGTIELEPGAASLTGVVENQSGDPLAQAEVSTAPWVAPGNIGPGTGPGDTGFVLNYIENCPTGPDGACPTAADGSFTINGLPPGGALVGIGCCGTKKGPEPYFDGQYDSANPPTNVAPVGAGGAYFFGVPPVPLVAGQTTDLGVVELYPVEPPTATIGSPSSGSLFALNESAATQFSCSEAPGGPGLGSCVDGNGVSAPVGWSPPPPPPAVGPASMAATGQLDTSSVGTFSYGVTASSYSGLTATTTTTYVVIGRQQCEKGGWRAFGVFEDQGDCVSFVATRGRNQPG